MNRVRRIFDIARLDWEAIRRSRWMTFMVVVYALLMGAFVLVGFRESDVVGFTGLGRVLLNFSNAIILFLPLVALFATAQVVPSAREDGTLELLLTHPFDRSDYFAGTFLARFATLVAPLIALAVLSIAASLFLGMAVPWGYLGNLLGASVTLIFAFNGIGLFISTHARSPERTLIWALVAWAAGIALLDFALITAMLQWRLEPASVFVLAVANPVECARLLLLSAAEPSLDILGPVGFFIVNRLGKGWLRLITLAWPVILGATTLAGAWFRFKRSDLV